jgi:hypothetical protein
LQRHEFSEVGRREPPADFRSAAKDAGVAARDVDEDGVEGGS